MTGTRTPAAPRSPGSATSTPAEGAAQRGALRVAFAGGGTGGHVVPGLHLVAHARAAGLALGDLLWFTSGRPVEERVFAGAAAMLEGLPCERAALPVAGRGGAAPSRTRLALRTPAATLVARERLRAHRSDVLLGLGGFTSLAPVLAARSLGVPVALLEVNAVRGAATRWLSRCATRTFHAFAGSLPQGAGPGVHPGPHVRTGPPLPPELCAGEPVAAERAAARAALGFDPGRALVVVLGGSQGAGALNGFVRAQLPRLLAGGVQVLHQTGPGRLGEAAEPRAGYRAVEYVDPVRPALVAATCALCRGGAATLAELAALRVPAFVAPYPQAAEDHQTRNASELGAGVRVVRDVELGVRCADELARLAGDEGEAQRAVMRAALARALPLDGAARIWDELAALAARRA